MKCKVTVDTSHYPKERPWELPKGWIWANLGELFLHNTGKALNAADRNGTLLTYITTSNLYWDRFELTAVKEMLFTEEEVEKCTAKKGDLLVCEGGDIGRAAIWNQDYDIRIQNHIHRLRGFGRINQRLFMFWLMFMKFEGMIGGKGIGLMGLSSRELDKQLMPLPPLKEQNYIVDRIDILFNAIGVLEQKNNSLAIQTSAAKAKVLDLAIHGKLVPQDPSDEPAIELLKRINPKIKPSDNLHYGDCPAGWLIVSFKEIITLYSGRDLEASRCNSEHRGLPYLVGASCIEGQSISIYRWTEFPEVISKKDDVLLSCKGTVGEVFLNTVGDVHIARQFMAIRSNSSHLIFPRYIELIIKASVEKLKKSARGIIPGISREDILEMVVAIPPIAEQRRIISRINEIDHSLSLISLNISK